MSRQSKSATIAAFMLGVILVSAIILTTGCSAKVQQPIAQSKLAEDSKPAAVSTSPEARPLTDVKFERTRARRERGKYLVEGVLACFACHSEPDYTTRGAPPKRGREGGGYVFTEDEADVPGRVVAPNISPDPETGAGTWTDDMFARAIREGIGHDGRALFPMMLYQNFRKLSDEDLASVVVYVRSIPPVRNALPKRELTPEILQSFQSIPKPITEPVPAPDLSTPVRNGEFLAHVADCYGCHTRTDKEEKPVFGAFGGGVMFKGPWGEAASANITTDPSGIPYYDENLYLQVIRTGKVKARELKPIMPWVFFRNMKDEDIKSIFAYLRTVKPVKHVVDNTEPPTDCKICSRKHGFGERN